jgi:dihydroorotase
VELIREDWQVPSTLTFGNDESVPTRGGDVVRWKVGTGNRPPLSDGAI